jgi:DNA ligase (NAD+)
MVAQNDFDKLVAELIHASELYYHDDGNSGLTDDEYDLKLEYLEQLVEKQPELKTEAYSSLTQSVAGGTLSNRADVQLEVPMLSLNKAKDEGTLRDFLNKTARYGADELGWQLQAKLDGIALSVRYKSGQLSQIITRSSGTVGTDVTQILFRTGLAESFGGHEIVGLPTTVHLDVDSELEVRGEIFMTREQFDYNNSQREQLLTSKPSNPKLSDLAESPQKTGSDVAQKLRYANPRNATAGVLNNDNLGYSAQLTFLVYSIVTTSSQNSVTFAELTKLGFLDALTVTRQILGRTTPYTSIDQVILDVKKYGQLIVRDNLVGKFINSPIGEILTDGIVVKCVDDARLTAVMGFTEHHPNSQIAYKYRSEDDWAVTTVQDIKVNVGRTGRLSLRARVDPVFLYGSTIQYATLHNFDWLQERDVRIGSKIALIKANDVIPYVSAVLENPDNTSPFQLLDHCPICNSELDKRTLLWRCPNDECSSRGSPALKQAVSRDYLDIESMSTQTLEALQNAGLVEDIADIFNLTEDQLANLPTGETYETTTKNHRVGDPILLGQKTAAKIYQSIQNAKLVGLPRVLSSLNIPGLGKRLGKNLARHFGNIDAIKQATIEQLQEVELVQTIKATAIHDGIKARANLIERLARAGVVLSVPEANVKENVADNNFDNALKLSGEVVVISGSIPGYNRQEAQNLVEQNGGTATSSVSNKTTLVVADADSTSSKVTKAKQLGIRIIKPETLLELLKSN